jgi:septal ring factor EnvC (AmiA/AmiB activator)
MSGKISFWVVVTILLAVKHLSAQTPEEVRSGIKEWVQLKKLISEEASDWQVEKAVISDMIQVLEQEEVDLKEKIESNNSILSTADRKRAELEDARKALLEASGKLESRLNTLEGSVRSLYAKFPEPLQEIVDPLVSRIPESDAEDKPALSIRLQSIVGVLSQADKFNAGITLLTELRGGESGTVEVKTLYFGLAGAIYSTVKGDSVGYGVPGDSGWQWQEAPDNKDSIIEAIRVYEGSKEAAFTPIPVKIQ